jgi:murein DD-endopeptidase MepM/ murein hydrolase activator NlpD
MLLKDSKKEGLDWGEAPRKKGIGNKILLLVVLGLFIAGGVFAVPRLEWWAPTVQIHLDSQYIGRRPFEIEIADRGTGLARVAVTLTAGGKELPIAAEEFPTAVASKKITVALGSEKLGVPEGAAVLQVRASDRSYFRFFRGNETVAKKDVIVDATPPVVEVLSDDRYVNFGGVGVVVYKASKDSVSSGVQIGNYFFPGYKGQLKNPESYLVFFSHPYNVPAEEKASIVASDAAGNVKKVRISYELKDVKYKKSTLKIDDSFIENKVAPLLGDGSAGQGDAKARFIKVNREMRKNNEEKILALCKNSAGTILWSGAFHQLSNSKVEANFADARTYVYNGEEIDHAYHLGYDLAVSKHTPIEVANSGVVVFAGELGIYGNTVIVDHGLGIFTLYGHLSAIDVKAGDKLEKRQVVGKTGETGLAVGDHLHYATLLHGIPVLPVEWWDQKWIRDNVLPKLQGDGESAQNVGESAPPRKSSPRAKSRRKATKS